MEKTLKLIRYGAQRAGPWNRQELDTEKKYMQKTQKS